MYVNYNVLLTTGLSRPVLILLTDNECPDIIHLVVKVLRLIK